MAIVVLTIAMPLSFLFSCAGEKNDMIEYAFDPETSYTLKEKNVETYISDSGITRYKVTADTWLMFGKASEPYQYFPDGGYYEMFDTLFNVEMSGQADTAYFFERRKLWKLIGHVDISNLEGVRFQTPLMYWDQNQKTIYSDSFIRITQGDKVQMGIGFKSNENMTIYEIYNSSADIPVDMQRRAIADSIPSDSLPPNSPQADLPPPNSLPSDSREPEIENRREMNNSPADIKK